MTHSSLRRLKRQRRAIDIFLWATILVMSYCAICFVSILLGGMKNDQFVLGMHYTSKGWMNFFGILRLPFTIVTAVCGLSWIPWVYIFRPMRNNLTDRIDELEGVHRAKI